jgi:Conserved hypothetical protein 2217 (DUF2460)
VSFINFPTPTPVFPNLPPLEWPVLQKPFFASWTHRSVSGKQWQSSRQVYPNYDFEVSFGKGESWLREQTQNQELYEQNSPFTEFQAISQLFLSCYGSYGEFYYDMPDDDSRLNQFVSTTVSGVSSYIIYRAWGGVTSAALQRFEPVGGVQLTQPISVYLNSVLVPSSEYQIQNQLSGSFLVFNTPPTAGQVCTITFSFYYRCHFLDSFAQFDQFQRNLWQFGRCRFRTVKP